MPDKYTPKTRIPSHSRGTKRGEEGVKVGGKEPGREKSIPTARSATSINPRSRDPIDKKMPHLQPA